MVLSISIIGVSAADTPTDITTETEKTPEYIESLNKAVHDFLEARPIFREEDYRFDYLG